MKVATTFTMALSPPSYSSMDVSRGRQSLRGDWMTPPTRKAPRNPSRGANLTGGGVVSLDDVTIGLDLTGTGRVRVPDVLDGRSVVEGEEENKKRRRKVGYKLHRRRGMILKFSDETDEVILKLSIPRLVGRQAYNFPLHQVGRIEDIDLGPVAAFVRDALGIRDVPVPLPRWPVVRWAAALDVDVGETALLPTMQALFTVQRDRAGHAQSWTNRNGLTGIQWGSKGNLRTMVYRKGAEILQRTPRRTRQSQDAYGHLDDDRRRDREVRKALADRAANILRFEVTIDATKPMRKLFDWPAPATPTFQMMAREDIQHFVLGRELQRLRLLELAELAAREAGVERPDIVEVLRQVILRVRSFNETVPERERFGLTESYKLAMFYLTDGLVKRPQVVQWNQGSGTSSLSGMFADLKQLGLTPLSAAPSLEHHHWLVGFASAVRRQLPQFPTSLAFDLNAAYGAGLAADAPWSDLVRGMEGISIDDEDDLPV